MQPFPVLILPNTGDLENKDIGSTEARVMSERAGFHFAVVSAKDGRGIMRLLESPAEHLEMDADDEKAPWSNSLTSSLGSAKTMQTCQLHGSQLFVSPQERPLLEFMKSRFLRIGITTGFRRLLPVVFRYSRLDLSPHPTYSHHYLSIIYA